MTLAYFDSFAGLIPCKVTKVERDEEGVAYVTFKVTSNRFKDHGYPCGKWYLGTGRSVVPRDAVRWHAGRPTIRPYEWINRPDFSLR